MPRRRYKRKPYRKYRRKNTSLTKYAGSGLTRSLPLGKSFKFRSRFVQTRVNLDPSSGGIAATQVYNLGSLYDPDVTGGGSQPLAFDQMMLMYNHYTVIGVRARITASNVDSSYACDIVASISDTTTVDTNTAQIIENGLCRWTRLDARGGGHSSRTLTINYSPKKFFGRNVLVDNDFRGTSSSSPTESAFLHITAVPTEAVNSTYVRCTVELEYISILTEPKTLSQS